MVTVAQRLRLRMWLCVGRVFQVWLVWRCCWATKRWQYVHSGACHRWAEAPVKIARMTLTIKLDRNWSSFQLANSAPPLSVTDSAIAPSAMMASNGALGESASVVRVRWRFDPRRRANARGLVAVFCLFCGAYGHLPRRNGSPRQHGMSAWVVGLHGSPQKL